jgi:hypothetical protein
MEGGLGGGGLDELEGKKLLLDELALSHVSNFLFFGFDFCEMSPRSEVGLAGTPFPTGLVIFPPLFKLEKKS